MAQVRRANVILEVKDEQVQYYLNKGYDVVDTAGNIVQKCVPRDVQTLQQAFVEHERIIAELQEQIKVLSQKKQKTPRSKTE